MIAGMSSSPRMPAGIRTASAASGPYDADESASSPKTGTPVNTHYSCVRDSDVANGRPKSAETVAERIDMCC